MNPSLYAAVFAEIRAKRPTELSGAEEMTALEKHALVAAVIWKLVPAEDGTRMEVVPLDGQTVYSISMRCTIGGFVIVIGSPLKEAG